MNFTLNFIPNAKQKEVLDNFYFSPDKDVALMSGGVRAGKTTLGHFLCAAEGQQNPGVDVIVIRSTHDEAITVSADQMFKMFESMGSRELRRDMEERFNKKEGILYMPNGSRVFFWGLGKEGEKNEMYEKIESAGFSFAFIDDARKIPLKVFNYIHTRMSGKGSRKILLSTNPPPERHWIHREFAAMVEKYPNRIWFRFQTKDN
jgi:hypothetical protein